MNWESYQPGGTAYNNAWNTFGQAVADKLAAAAYDEDWALVGDIIDKARAAQGYTAAPTGGSTSTLGNLYTQLTTNPLSAPLDGANNIIQNSFLSLLKNPWVLVTIAALVFFFLFDGMTILRKKLA